jgi:hypothetical protein
MHDFLKLIFLVASLC